MMDLPFVGGAAAVGLLATCWMWCRSFMWKCVSLFIGRASLSSTVGEHVQEYLWNNCRRSPFSERRYGGCPQYVRPLRQHRTVAYESLSRDPTIFWIGWRPVFVGSRVDSSGSGASNAPTAASDAGITMTYIRGTLDVEKLILDCLENGHSQAESQKDRFMIRRYSGQPQRYRKSGGGGVTASPEASSKHPTGPAVWKDVRFLGYAREDLQEEKQGRLAFSYLAFPPEVEEIKRDIMRWKLGKDWYSEKRIPWRRGWGIHGGPGTGKSSCVKALGQWAGIPVMIFDLGSMCNDELIEYWGNVLDHAPCIVLVEDIDAVFHGRENITGENGGGLTFDCLLNVISGIQNADGIFLIVTTNHPDKLDPALGKPQASQAGGDSMISTRPGRLDRMLELKSPTPACLRQIAERILADCPEEIDKTVEAGIGESGAQFQERCAQIALRHYWDSKSVAQVPTEMLGL